MREQQTWLVNIDYFTFCLYLALIFVGWLMIFTVGNPVDGYPTDVASFLATPVGKQTIWIAICLLLFGFIVFFTDPKFWQTFAYLIYGIGLIFLILVLFFGREINGAKAWFTFGGAAFQPSEIVKFGTALAMSAYLSHWSTKLTQLRSAAVAVLILLVPAALILLQPDAGSALVFFSFFIVLYREGMSVVLYIIGIFTAVMFVLGILTPPLVLIAGLLWRALLIYAFNTNRRTAFWVLAAAAAGAGAFWLIRNEQMGLVLSLLGGAFVLFSILQYFNKHARVAVLMGAMLIYGAILVQGTNYAFNNILQPHQQERLNVWLQPELSDPRGARYNVLQSQMAISAGGLTGKGLMEGTMTKLNYVPEQQTDFIFCAVGEEQGFVGSAAIIALFLLLIYRLTVIAERQRQRFARIYAYSVAGILFIHMFVNIGMTMGLLPIIGIPLPFISKGGSSLLGFTIMLAVLLKLDKHRNRVKVLRF